MLLKWNELDDVMYGHLLYEFLPFEKISKANVVCISPITFATLICLIHLNLCLLNTVTGLSTPTTEYVLRTWYSVLRTDVRNSVFVLFL